MIWQINVTKHVVFASDWAGTSENLINNKIQNLLKAEKLLKKIDKSSKLYERYQIDIYTGLGTGYIGLNRLVGDKENCVTSAEEEE